MTLNLPFDPPSAAAIKYTSLVRLLQRVQAVLEPTVDKSFYLRAELSVADERAGVFYGEFTECSRQGKVIAKLRCMIWSEDLRRIRARFAREGLELSLQRGSVIGVQCVLQFHAVHGMSVRVLDMDPAFFVGELELRRRRALANLARDGLLARNASVPIPLIPNRIVLITSAKSAACQDFLRTLYERRCGVRVWLADATVQGPETESSLLRALAAAEMLAPDLVVVIRGGGSKTDLSWLDSEAIARRIATFGRPVWTGIGHETDRSVLDAVAAHSFRTPTAVAEALAARIERVDTRMEEFSIRLRETFVLAHRRECENLRKQAQRVTQVPRQRIAQGKVTIEASRQELHRKVQARLTAGQIAWTACAHMLQQVTQRRVGTLQRSLQSLRSDWYVSARSVIERRRAAFATSSQRFDPRRVLARLAAERLQVSHLEQSSRRGSAARLASQQALLGVATSNLRTRLKARLANARVALAPHAYVLRRAFEARVRTAVSRVASACTELRRASLRALERQQDTFDQVRGRVTAARALAPIEGARMALAQRSLLVRAHDPRNALARGFSLTYGASGQLIRSASALAPTETIRTQFADGHALATVLGTQSEPNNE